MEYPQLKGLPECPLVTEVIKLEHEKLNFGGVWHSDTAYLKNLQWQVCSTRLRFLRTVGIRFFPTSTWAHENLSDGFKKTLSELIAVNSSSKPEVSMTREDRMSEAGMELNVLDALHPLFAHTLRQEENSLR
ncbi:MAG: hypothetical protein CM1200mP30_17810 [Pseudomonadota bacterium]|nr:MAG: hypothetical protein CM1200mP30_17810 [Pseudomonadota bacterium]